MLGSIRIGTVFGIQLRMHWMFPAIVPFMMWTTGYSLQVVVQLTLMLFSIVILHELGHSLMARRLGIRVLDITIWPLGGMARMSEIPENTRTEILIAIAGPAVNFLLAFLAAPFLIWSMMATSADGGSAVAEFVLTGSGLFIIVNLMLGGFNLVPAFPMDGGRVLRAFLGRKGDWIGATEKAVKVGKVFAALMVVAWLVVDSGFFLPLIGMFIWFTGSRELRAVRMRHAPAFEGPFGPIFSSFAQAAGARPAAAEAVHHPPEPSAEPSGARRPSGSSAGQRLSDEDIERLERFRGRLGGFSDE